MTTTRTADRLDHLPHWFSAQATGVDEPASQRREREANHQALEFLCAVEVMDSGWEDWQDTVAAFNGPRR